MTFWKKAVPQNSSRQAVLVGQAAGSSAKGDTIKANKARTSCWSGRTVAEEAEIVTPVATAQAVTPVAIGAPTTPLKPNIQQVWEQSQRRE